jgi:hypothetical protein
LDLGKKYKFKKVVPAVAPSPQVTLIKNPSGRTVPIKKFDFLSLRGTNRNFVKSICLNDAKGFEVFFLWAKFEISFSSVSSITRRGHVFLLTTFSFS